jgi:hypothetical protein
MDDELKKQTEILKEMLKWVKFSGMKSVKEVLLNNLTDDTKILVYHYSDGVNSIPMLKNLIGIKGNVVIFNLWNKWKNIGIMEKVPAKGGERGKKIFHLEDFGIQIPEIKKQETEGINEARELLQEEDTEENKVNEEIKEENSENGQKF